MAKDEIKIKIKGDASNYKKATKGAVKSTGFLKKGLASVKSSLKGLLTNPFVLLAAGAVALYQGMKKAIGEASKLETVTTQFATLTGSVAKARDHVKDLVEFTAKTPFQFDSVAKASSTLLSFGVELDSIKPKLQAIGDVASASGSDIKDIALIFGQVQAAGKLTGERLLQLQERGVPVLAALAKKFGTTTGAVQKMVTAGKISSSVFNEVFESMNKEGSFAFGAMEKQSQTLAGKWSTLKDGVSIFAQTIGTLLLPAAKAVIGHLIRWAEMATMAGKAITKLFGMAKARAGEIK